MLASLKFVERFVALPRVRSEGLTASGAAFERFDPDLSVIAPLLTRQGFEVESTQVWGEGFDRVVVGRIVEASRHPKAEKLQVCLVDVGEASLRQIVCGAANARAGLFVAAALPGAKLPGGMEIKDAKLRDVESRGMLCSREELGLPVNASLDGDGIWELHLDASCGAPEGSLAKVVGLPVFDALGLRDVLLELNVTPNRPDVLAHEGVAREIFAGLGHLGLPSQWRAFGFSQHSPVREAAVVAQACESGRIQWPARAFACENALGVPAFFCGLEGVEPRPSPGWLRAQLEALGQSSINTVVDASNFILLALGQPSHAFDLAKIAGGRLALRSAREGEAFLGLDGKERTLVAADCVVADGERPQALLGVIGGELSKVTENTNAVVLEFANPHPVAVRRTSRRHGRKTDSSFLFEKGIDVADRFRAAVELVGLISHLSPKAPRWMGACGSLLAEVRNQDSKEFMDDESLTRVLGPNMATGLAVDASVAAVRDCGQAFVTPGWVTWRTERLARLATDWSGDALAHVTGSELVPFETQLDILRSLGFGVVSTGAGMARVAFPHWRWLDVVGTADLAEEIVRVVGIDQIPSIPLVTEAQAAKDDPHIAPLEAACARAAAMGYTEIAGYHFMRLDDLEKLGLGGPSALGEPLALLNPIIRDQPLMHTTLFANLLRCAGRNASFGVNRGMLFHSTRTYQNLDVDGNRVFAGNGSDLGLATGALATRESLREYAPQRSYPYSREATLAGRPAETPRLGGVAFGAREEKAWHNSGASAWTLLEIAAHALACAQAMGVALRLEEMPSDHPIALALHPGRRAALMTPHGEPAGWVGEVHPAALRAFDVPVHTLGFELNLAVVMEAARAGEATRKRVVAPLRFPPVSRDFAFLLSEKVEAGGLSEVVREALTGSSEPGVRSLSQVPARLVEVKVFDVYRGKGVPSGFKSVAFNVTVEPLERTLTDKDIQWLQGRVVECVVGRLEGELRGG